MIKSFKHRGLKKLFLNGDRSGVPPRLVLKLELMLSRLDAADSIQGMDMPGYKLHPLKGNLKNFWSTSISGNMRLTFCFDSVNKEAYDVNLIDYH